ncbi:MAG: symmetrical bis(5'-nucleosyl)-tetraphosphatase [Kofleriaceae bacterium]
MSRYAIGDIQGCMSSLERLLAKIAFSPSRDSLWLTGDLVNRGPRSLDVLRWARANEGVITTILGNHDLHLLARVAGAHGEKKRDTLDDILHAPDRDELIDWLRTRPIAYVEADMILIHAGLHPQWTVLDAQRHAHELEPHLRGDDWKQFMAKTSGSGAPVWSEQLTGADRWRAQLSYFVRARMLDATTGALVSDYDGGPAEAPAGTIPWFLMPAKWQSHTAVFGHWAALGLDVGHHHIGLDSGCVWGKALTAITLPERVVTQVKAVEKAS